MSSLFPNKLKSGDEIRIIAPSRSLKIVSEKNVQRAIQALEKLGFKVTFGRHLMRVTNFSPPPFILESLTFMRHFKTQMLKLFLPLLVAQKIGRASCRERV